jgi:ubiquinone/menaquinone biosynthesis C-methylase UbiE
LSSLLTPRRRRGVEYLDQPGVEESVVRRSLGDVARANALFGGTRAVVEELEPALRALGALGARGATLLDVGTGLGDIPRQARWSAAALGIELTVFGLDGNEVLARAVRDQQMSALRGDARQLPFADRSVDFVLCSQLLHHFEGSDARVVLRELNRVARRRVIVGELRRSWIAAAGIWLASFPLAFHPVSRHDGVISVLRGFTIEELARIIQEAVGVHPEAHRRLGFRVTASWSPLRSPQ